MKLREVPRTQILGPVFGSYNDPLFPSLNSSITPCPVAVRYIEIQQILQPAIALAEQERKATLGSSLTEDVLL